MMKLGLRHLGNNEYLKMTLVLINLTLATDDIIY